MPVFEPIAESVFAWAAPPLKFGCGAVAELGEDASGLGMERCLVLTDAGVVATGITDRVTKALKSAGVACDVFDGVAVEPTDASIETAVEAAGLSDWDGYVAVGGGSAIDTAKAVNLHTIQPGNLTNYLAAPIGGGQKPKLPIKPLIAVPTTSGTGFEATTICVVDLLSQRLKAGISHPRLRPTLAVVEPTLTVTMPPEVDAACGMEVLTHALESYTARPFHARSPVANASARGGFSGSNAISDTWCEKAIELVGTPPAPRLHRLPRPRSPLLDILRFRRDWHGIWQHRHPHSPRQLLPHPPGAAHDYQAQGYPDMPMVPHTQAVASSAVATFRYTYPATPERHLHSASLIRGPQSTPMKAARHSPCSRRAHARRRHAQRPPAFGLAEPDLPTLARRHHETNPPTHRRPTHPHQRHDILRESPTNW